jgi:hypothetical protein
MPRWKKKKNLPIRKKKEDKHSIRPKQENLCQGESRKKETAQTAKENKCSVPHKKKENMPRPISGKNEVPKQSLFATQSVLRLGVRHLGRDQ